MFLLVVLHHCAISGYKVVSLYKRLDVDVYLQLTESKAEYDLPVGDKNVLTKLGDLEDAIRAGGLVAVDQNSETGVGKIRLWTGTLAEYQSLENIDEAVIYHVRG